MRVPQCFSLSQTQHQYSVAKCIDQGLSTNVISADTIKFKLPSPQHYHHSNTSTDSTVMMTPQTRTAFPLTLAAISTHDTDTETQTGCALQRSLSRPFGPENHSHSDLVGRSLFPPPPPPAGPVTDSNRLGSREPQERPVTADAPGSGRGDVTGPLCPDRPAARWGSGAQLRRATTARG